MKAFAKFSSVGLAFSTVAAVMALSGSAVAQIPSGSMTITGVAGAGGTFDYTVTLQNTSGAGINLNDLWLGWTVTQGNTMPSAPSTPGNNLGWANNPFGNSIQFVNSTGTALAPGQTGTFTFVSTSDIAAIESTPADSSVAYEHGIDFSQGTSGSSTEVITPTAIATPEPSTWSLLGMGLLAALGGSWRKLARQ